MMLSDFGVEVEFTPVSGVARRFNGIFDAETVEAVGGGFVDVDSVRPMLTCKWSDVKDDIAIGDSFRILVDDTFTTFHVAAINQDGTGLVIIFLEDQT